jgi:hypothetical protein
MIPVLPFYVLFFGILFGGGIGAHYANKHYKPKSSPSCTEVAPKQPCVWHGTPTKAEIARWEGKKPR